MYQKRWENYYYFPSKPIILSDKWVRLRRIGQRELSPQAQLKLEWMIFYFTIAGREATKTAGHFGISRKTLRKWLGRFDETNLKSLEEKSRRPDHVRTWTVTPQEEERVVALRQQHLKWGKQKLQRVYRKIYPGESISAHKIQRVINVHKLYPEPDQREKRQQQSRRRGNKTYIHTLDKQPELGFLWHTDTIIIWWYGVRRVIFTALEEMTKINQVYSRVRTPKDNPALERFNRTIQDEWLSLSKVGLDDINQANQDLTE